MIYDDNYTSSLLIIIYYTERSSITAEGAVSICYKIYDILKVCQI